MSTTIAEKIGKLLAKAEGTDNAHEAEAFMAKAEALMIEQGITEAIARQAAGANVAPESIVERRFNFYVPPAPKLWRPTDDAPTLVCARCERDLPASKYPTTKAPGVREITCRECRDARLAAGETDRVATAHAYNRAHMSGMTTVLATLGLRAYKTGDTTIYVVGFERDADRAVGLLASLQVQAVSAMWRWWKVAADEPRMTWAPSDIRSNARRDFIFSFYQGAADRIRSERTEQVKATPGAGLALIDKDKAVRDHFDGLDLVKGRGTSFGSSSAGRTAGRSANVGTGSVGGGRGAIGR